MPACTVDCVASAGALSGADWAHLAPAGHPFLNARFLDILERHGTAGPAGGWMPRHWVARDAGGMVRGLLPCYVKAHSHGDFIGDWSWAGAYRQLGLGYYPKLHSGLPHTPAGGPRLLLAPGDDAQAVGHNLIEAVKAQFTVNPWSSWHVALPAAGEVELFRANGLLVSHDVQFHWRNRGWGDFDQFLGAFPSEKRRKLRAERRRVAASGLAIETLHGHAVDPAEWPALHGLYAATFAKYGNHAAFSSDCFAELAAALGDRMVLFIAREQGTPVALSICFRSNDTLYGRYWGNAADYHSLHFELCFYQGIDYCLRKGLRTFEPGAGGEHKIARGFEPTIVRSCHWIEDTRMRTLIGRHLERHQQAVQAYAEEAATHLPYRRGELGETNARTAP